MLYCVIVNFFIVSITLYEYDTKLYFFIADQHRYSIDKNIYTNINIYNNIDTNINIYNNIDTNINIYNNIMLKEIINQNIVCTSKPGKHQTSNIKNQL